MFKPSSQNENYLKISDMVNLRGCFEHDFHDNISNILVLISSQFMDDQSQDNHDLPYFVFCLRWW